MFKTSLVVSMVLFTVVVSLAKVMTSPNAQKGLKDSSKIMVQPFMRD